MNGIMLNDMKDSLDGSILRDMGSFETTRQLDVCWQDIMEVATFSFDVVFVPDPCPAPSTEACNRPGNEA